MDGWHTHSDPAVIFLQQPTVVAMPVAGGAAGTNAVLPVASTV